ncbi:MAG: DegQ family serine endoprotease [Rhodocyclaceae bacterium]
MTPGQPQNTPDRRPVAGLRPLRQALLLATSLFLFAGCGQQGSTPPAEPRSGETASGATLPLPDFTALVRKQGPAVVNISSTKTIKGSIPFPAIPGLSSDAPLYELLRRFGLADMPPQALYSQSRGSGFIIDREGHILTNSHVVEDADEVIVGLTDKREFKAKIVGIDQRSDVALLKISAKNLPVAQIGDPSRLDVGEWVIAIGAPFGFANSVTQGIVSAKGRDLPGQDLVPFIQTDVAINPGSSGGPLFNLNGEVVGINAQIFSQSGGSMGISFAIPIDVAMKVKEQLLKNGSVQRGKLGVAVQEVSADLAESFGLEKARGALISALEKGGPAERAGLSAGDIVLALDGREIASPAEFSRFISETVPGQKIRIRLWRNGAASELVAKLADASVATQERKASKSGGQEPDRRGLSLRDLSPAERRAQQSEGTVIVDSVEGLAALSGIQPGDIILAINHTPVSDTRQLHGLLAKAGKRVALLIQRDATTKIFISLSLGK